MVHDFKEKGITYFGKIPEGTEYVTADKSLSSYLNKSYMIKPGETMTLSNGFHFKAENGQTFSIGFEHPDSTMLDTWGFQKRYDEKNRLIAQKSPGTDWVYMVYDKWNRLVYTQDGVQRETNEWTFTKYDRHDRPVMTGFVTLNNTREELAASLEGLSSSERSESDDSALGNYNAIAGYTLNQTHPKNITMNNIFTISYYDDYSFMTDVTPFSSAGSIFSFQTDLSYTTSDKLDIFRGQVTGSQTRILDGSGTMLKTISYYDDRYQVIQLISDNHLGGWDRVSNRYSFTGNLTESLTTHSTNLPGESERTIKLTYSYDHADRLLEVVHQVQNKDPVILSRNEYNELGELINRKLDSKDNGTSFAQSIDYDYNVRGWMTRINDAALSDPNDLFGMEMYYTTGFDTDQDQYGGNISGVKWKSALDDAQRQYGYVYDNTNKIRFGDYHSSDGTENQRYDVEMNGFDKNGNITGIKRKGLTSDLMAEIKTFGDIDDLTYSYSGNQLQAVDDSKSTTYVGGFNDNGSTYSGTEEYIYDANGNLIKDTNKGITNIEYNEMNLPSKIEFDQNRYIVFTYDAAGTKLRQQIVNGSIENALEIDYIGEYMYMDSVLIQIFTEEGRIVDPYFGGMQSDYQYQYFLTDHLGNTRVAFTEKETLVYELTHETSNQTYESSVFENYGDLNIISADIYDHTGITSPGKSERLSGITTEIIGGSKMLVVGKGDQVVLDAYAKYLDPSNPQNTTVAADILDAITGAFNVSAGEQQIIYDAFYDLFSTGPVIGTEDLEHVDAPKAFLNYILFDGNFIFQDMGFDQISTAALEDGTDIQHEHLTLTLDVEVNGFLYVYLSNENDETVDVYFDDLTITHELSPVIQAEDYYLFGGLLAGNSYQRLGTEKNRYLYQ